MAGSCHHPSQPTALTPRWGVSWSICAQSDLVCLLPCCRCFRHLDQLAAASLKEPCSFVWLFVCLCVCARVCFSRKHSEGFFERSLLCLRSPTFTAPHCPSHCPAAQLCMYSLALSAQPSNSMFFFSRGWVRRDEHSKGIVLGIRRTAIARVGSLPLWRRANFLNLDDEDVALLHSASQHSLAAQQTLTFNGLAAQNIAAHSCRQRIST